MAATSQDLWWTDLKAVISATWGCSIERTPSLDRNSIINLLKDAKKVPPFCIVEVGKKRAADNYGTQEASYLQPVSIVYMVKTNDPNALIDSLNPSKGYDVEQYTLNQASALNLALIKANKQYFQMAPPWPSTNIESWASMNRTLLGASYPYFCSKIEVELLVGDTLSLGAP